MSQTMVSIAIVEAGTNRAWAVRRFVPLFAVLVAVADLSASPPPAQAQGAAIGAAEIVRLTNVARRNAGLPALQWNTTIQNVAQNYAARMANLQKMDHNLDGNAASRLARGGYGRAGTFAWGENIAEGYRTSDAVVQGWLNSPGHRANILNANFTQIGVGIASDRNGVPYYCQDFARPPGT